MNGRGRCSGWRAGCLLLLGLVVGCEESGPARTCANHAGCEVDELCIDQICQDAAGTRQQLGGGGVQPLLVFDTGNGTFDIYGPGGEVLIRAASGLVEADGYTQSWSTSALRDPQVQRSTGVGRLGPHETLELSYAGQGDRPTLLWRASLYDDGAFVLRLGVKNHRSSPLVVDKLVPLRTRGEEGGGFFLGADPRQHRILENGANGLTDHYAALEMGDKPTDLITKSAPGKLEGRSASNFSHLLWDSASGATWIAGALTAEVAVSVIQLSYRTQKEEITADERIGFGFYSVDGLYLPDGKPVRSDETLQSEWYYVHPTQTDPHQALEDYAQAIHDQQQLVTWLDRGHRVPNGWNSWSASSGTGGYGTGIDQALMESNLAVFVDHFKDWGMDYFQMDDGWELDYGDWQVNTTRFPDGFSPDKGIVRQILDGALIPGLWIAAFSAYDTSELYKSKQPAGWFMPYTMLGTLAFQGYKMLDFTNPEVIAWLKATASQLRQWGFRWVKLDFSYPALLCHEFHDSDRTAVEVYNAGLKAMQAALGDDTFFLNVGPVGIGVASGKRTTMDNMPTWDGQAGVLAMQQQGFKPTIATAARRYWYHGRVFIHHPDLIIFRSDTQDPTIPRITFEETRAFAAFIAASGGIVKLGDRLVEDIAPYPERINLIRQLLPIHPQAARPLDLLEREYPERYFKIIDKTLGGYEARWGWYAALNLGSNRDYTTNPPTEIPDDGKPRVFEIDPTKLGLQGDRFHVFELWEQRYLGLQAGTFEVTVPTHDSRIFAIRAALNRPQLLGSNRHITMGAATIHDVAWDKGQKTLTVVLDATASHDAAPFVYRLSFHGNGLALKDAKWASTSPKELSVKDDGPVVEVSVRPAVTEKATLELSYR